MSTTKILVVEDDHALADVLDYNLTREGYDVTRAYDGRDGLTQARLKMPDIVILDVMLPLVDGVEVCRQLRSSPETRGTVIIMLTAKSEESDQLVGFSVGADDYVLKPFSVRVLLERIRALRRRRDAAATLEGEVVACHGITLDRRRHQALVEGQPVDLTRSEFRLLETLIRQPGRAFDRSELIDAALGEDTLVLERTIDVHIRALRRKLGDAADAIETVRGVGYRFRDSHRQDVAES
jgi:two-component system, OmpR family, phosphate regulon response regulator PhoB